ncbi:PEP-CTERM sorting domain-containing protein [Duganella sp. PWIR1]
MNRIARVITILLPLVLGLGIDARAQGAPEAVEVAPAACLTQREVESEVGSPFRHDPCRLDDADRVISYAEGLENRSPAHVQRASDWIVPRTGVTEQDVGLRRTDAPTQPITAAIPAVPEPATYVTMLAGLVVVLLASRKKGSRSCLYNPPTRGASFSVQRRIDAAYGAASGSPTNTPCIGHATLRQ